uniref:Uncharacterized protein n=1 Tax=Timema douglasi TaxID=61478 RepID=A0A7R8ZF65_TIMDO|nr:unnamed protein product [Timema douglasi]
MHPLLFWADLDTLDRLILILEAGNGVTVLSPPLASSPPHHTARAPPPNPGDGARTPAAMRETGIVAAATVGPSSAAQPGFSGSVNQVGGALSDGIPLRVVEERIKQLRRFFYTGRELTVHLGAPASDRDALSWLEEQITNLLHRLKDHGVSADDHVGFLLSSTDSTLSPVYVSFRRADQLDARAVLDNVGRVLQSNTMFLSTAPLYVKLSHFKEPRGIGNHKCDKFSPAITYSRNNKGIITIQNGDTLCLARALVVAKAMCDNKREPG